jgi:drug/metabolite transporter (DMT)-like permease
MTAPGDPHAHRRALALLALCGLLWSTAGALIKLVAWHPGAIWSARCAIAAALLYAIRRPAMRGIAPAEWSAAAALAATTGLFILANKLTSPANAILIQYSAPVWVALLGPWAVGERVTRLDGVAIAIVLGGIALFFLDQLTFDHALGNVVALGAGVAFACSALAMRRVALTLTPAGPIDPLRPLVLGNLLGAVIGAPFWLVAPSLDAVGWSALLAHRRVPAGRGLFLLCGRDPPRPRDRRRARAGDRADSLAAVGRARVRRVAEPLGAARRRDRGGCGHRARRARTSRVD